MTTYADSARLVMERCDILGAIGESVPRRPRPDDQPSRPRAMPQQMAIGAGRNTRQQLGLDQDDLEGWPE